MLLLSCRHGAQGVLDTASHAAMENEFGTFDLDEVIKKILENGSIQDVEVSTLGPWILWSGACEEGGNRR